MKGRAGGSGWFLTVCLFVCLFVCLLEERIEKEERRLKREIDC